MVINNLSQCQWVASGRLLPFANGHSAHMESHMQSNAKTWPIMEGIGGQHGTVPEAAFLAALSNFLPFQPQFMHPSIEIPVSRAANCKLASCLGSL